MIMWIRWALPNRQKWETTIQAANGFRSYLRWEGGWPQPRQQKNLVYLVGNEVGARYEGPLCALRIPNAKHLYLLGPAESYRVLYISNIQFFAYVCIDIIIIIS